MGLIAFFDGDCGFCSRSVLMVHRMDSNRRIQFAPLQGKLSEEEGLTQFAKAGAGTMVVQREGFEEKLFRSDAVLAILEEIGGVWKYCAKFGQLFPKALRDSVYDLIARNRSYLSIGSDQCVLDPSLEKQMLE